MERKPTKSNMDLSCIVDAVQKKFGTDSITLLSEHAEFAAVRKFVSFGHWGLDRIVSGLYQGGGVPIGRLTEIYGGFSTGKSLIIAHLIAECQKAGGYAILDDTEHAYLKDFGEIIGVNNDNLLYTASETVEEVFDKMEFTIKQILAVNPNALIFYAWDSLALVSSEAEKSQVLSESSGFHTEKAIAIGRGVRKVVSVIGKANVALVIANQVRKNVGVMFGDSETTPGGDAVPFWGSVRIRLSKKELIKDPDTKEVLGVRGEAVVKKNKVSRPFKSCGFEVYFDKGLAYASGCVDLLIKDGIAIEAGKGWYQLKGDDKKWQKSQLEKYFSEHPEKLFFVYKEE